MRHVKPPIAAKRPAVVRHHGIELIDDYAWLRASNWEDVIDDPTTLAPHIRSHLEAENAYTQSTLAGTARLRETLAAEMKARIAEDDSTAPETDGPWEYYSRYVEGGEYPLFCRRPVDGGDESVLLDCSREADGKPFWAMEEAIHSPDHRYLAYSVDPKGSERFNIRIRDLTTGKNLPDRISGTTGDIAWSLDSKQIFYVHLDARQRPMQAWRHKIGTRMADDVLVFQEKDPVFEVSVGVTQSGAYVLVETHAHDSSEIWLIDAAAPESPLRLVAPREVGHDYVVDHAGDRLIITTNSAGAADFRICETSAHDPAPANWREIVPHRPGRRIIDTIAYSGHLARLEREDGQPRIVIRRWSDAAEHEIAFSEPAYDLNLSPGFEYRTTATRIVYSSMTTPARVYDYDMETRTRVLRKTQAIPSGHDPSHYVTARLHALAPDGESVPVSILHRYDTPIDGTAPVLLTAYGAYGVPVDAEFDALQLSLVDRGFVVALAHVRGGEDKGQAWYDAGRHRSKFNTFTDFIAAAEHLIAQGYTRPGRIIASAESAGGILVGAVANMRPDLWLAVIAYVPFVDVLNTMLDASLPMTPAEWSEWGNPIDSREDFELIASYCPYENVTAQAYPHILANASLADLRVAYWEPAKWIARLRERKTDDNLLLLRMNMTAGHGGASGRFQRLHDFAFDYAFALKVAGLDEGKTS